MVEKKWYFVVAFLFLILGVLVVGALFYYKNTPEKKAVAEIKVEPKSIENAPIETLFTVMTDDEDPSRVQIRGRVLAWVDDKLTVSTKTGNVDVKTPEKVQYKCIKSKLPVSGTDKMMLVENAYMEFLSQDNVGQVVETSLVKQAVTVGEQVIVVGQKLKKEIMSVLVVTMKC